MNCPNCNCHDLGSRVLCYYAHPITDYDTRREFADVRTLERMGLDVLNPNAPIHAEAYKTEGMEYFTNLIKACGALAYRAFPDGSLGAGVVKEIETALMLGIPVIELPYHHNARHLDVQATRAKIAVLRGRAARHTGDDL